MRLGMRRKRIVSLGWSNVVVNINTYINLRKFNYVRLKLII